VAKKTGGQGSMFRTPEDPLAKGEYGVDNGSGRLWKTLLLTWHHFLSIDSWSGGSRQGNDRVPRSEQARLRLLDQISGGDGT
jgi:hypothetical protein